jgi:glycyl-tRNA synthetase beta subunit
MQKRRRFKQITSLQERIAKFSEDVRTQADNAADKNTREELLKKLRAADTAADLDRRLSIG